MGHIIELQSSNEEEKHFEIKQDCGVITVKVGNNVIDIQRCYRSTGDKNIKAIVNIYAYHNLNKKLNILVKQCNKTVLDLNNEA